MNKKWLIIILLFVALGVLIYLNEKGIIHWQALTILGAAIMGPFKYITSLFKSDKQSIDEINAQHAAIKAREEKYQQSVADELKKRDEEIARLNKNQQDLENKMKELEVQKSNIASEVKAETIPQKEQEGKDLFGG